MTGPKLISLEVVQVVWFYWTCESASCSSVHHLQVGSLQRQVAFLEFTKKKNKMFRRLHTINSDTWYISADVTVFHPRRWTHHQVVRVTGTCHLRSSTTDLMVQWTQTQECVTASSYKSLSLHLFLLWLSGEYRSLLSCKNYLQSKPKWNTSMLKFMCKYMHLDGGVCIGILIRNIT